MFSVITSQMIQECGQLEKQVYEMSGQMAELEGAIRGIQSLSCMEEPVAKLKHLYSEMDSEHNVFDQMMRVLNKTTLNYVSCENRICGMGEQNAILYTRQEGEAKDFSGMSEILRGI